MDELDHSDPQSDGENEDSPRGAGGGAGAGSKRPVPGGAGSGPSASGRIARACAACNKIKLRCDGNHPCSRCLRSGKADECVFLPSMRGKTKRKKTQHDADTSSTNPAQPVQAAQPYNGFEYPSFDGNMGPAPMQQSAPAPRPHVYQNERTNSSFSAQGSYEPTPRRQPSFDRSAYQHTTHRPQSHDRSTSRTRHTSRSASPSALPNVQTAFRIPVAPGGPRRTSSAQDRAALTSLPLPGDAHNPLGVLAEASATIQIGGPSPERGHAESDARHAGHGASRPGGKGEGKDYTDYYAASPAVSAPRSLSVEAPHIMRIITPAEAESLFEVYWRNIHPHLPCLDQEHSSPIDVACRSNFLFNAICCISARSFNVALWEKLRAFAKTEMTRFPLEKNLDVVQGHLIYSEWNLIPARRFEQDMTWLRVGMAVRTAIDINLHRFALSPELRSTLPSWILRSMIRTWLLAFTTDRTLSAELGKPSSMRGENSVRKYLALLKEAHEGVGDGAGGAESKLQDVAVISWTEWTQILARALDVFRSDANQESQTSSLGSQNCYPDLVVVFEKQFGEWRTSALGRVDEVQAVERKAMLAKARINMYFHYARLVIASFGLSRATDHNRVDLPAALARFQSTATHIIECFEFEFDNTGFTRGCPDFVFTALTYGVVSLLKSTQERYASCSSVPHEAIFRLCRTAAGMLSRAASTPDHLPSLQSGFLTRLLDIRTAESYTAETVVPQMVDFQAFADSIETDPTKSHWPPSAVNSPNARKKALESTGFDTSSFVVDPAIGGHGQMSMENGAGNLAYQVTNGANFGGANGFNGFDALGGFGNLGFPDVPTASFGLSVGSFMPHANMDDLMFTNDALWQSILNAPPQAAPRQGMMG